MQNICRSSAAISSAKGVWLTFLCRWQNQWQHTESMENYFDHSREQDQNLGWESTDCNKFKICLLQIRFAQIPKGSLETSLFCFSGPFAFFMWLLNNQTATSFFRFRSVEGEISGQFALEGIFTWVRLTSRPTNRPSLVHVFCFLSSNHLSDNNAFQWFVRFRQASVSVKGHQHNLLLLSWCVLNNMHQIHESGQRRFQLPNLASRWKHLNITQKHRSRSDD